MQQSDDLLAVINCFKEPAIVLSLDYKILLANEAYREVYGAPGKLTRSRCYEVSHRYTVPCDLAGESCPLRQSLATGQNSRVLHIHHTPRGEEYVNVEMWPVKDPHSGEVKYFIERMRPSDVAVAYSEGDKLVGRSPVFQRMLGLVERVAGSLSTVMLLGETGTGKELVAQSIHRLSERSDGAFVPVECTGLPETLFESELFGHEKGAFTGAVSSKIGLVEAAQGGTLFLDEIGDIPLSDQVKLLRLLETRRFRRVGSTEWREADFRLICATNKDLKVGVQTGSFREDLYYRLNVFEIELPPLRQRRGDLPMLVTAILARLGRGEMRFSKLALSQLERYEFPGNIRELRNIVERAVLLADDDVVGPEHLPEVGAGSEGMPQGGNEIVSLEEAEQRYLKHVLATYTGERKSLAAQLGISERALYRKLAALRSDADFSTEGTAGGASGQQG